MNPDPSSRDGERVRQSGGGDGDHLPPHWCDRAAPAGEDQYRGRDRAHADAGQRSVADLLEQQSQRRAVPDGTGLGVRDREHDQEQWHADAVVEAALDVEPLSDMRRQIFARDHGLPQGGVGRRENDGEQQHLRPFETAEHQCGGAEPGKDGQRQADSEKPGGNRDLGAERGDVHACGVGEEHQSQRRLGEQFDGVTHRVEIDRIRCGQAQDRPADHEDDRRGERRALEATRDCSVGEDDRRDRGQRPRHLGRTRHWGTIGPRARRERAASTWSTARDSTFGSSAALATARFSRNGRWRRAGIDDYRAGRGPA